MPWAVQVCPSRKTPYLRRYVRWPTSEGSDGGGVELGADEFSGVRLTVARSAGAGSCGFKWGGVRFVGGGGGEIAAL